MAFGEVQVDQLLGARRKASEYLDEELNGRVLGWGECFVLLAASHLLLEAESFTERQVWDLIKYHEGSRPAGLGVAMVRLSKNFELFDSEQRGRKGMTAPYHYSPTETGRVVLGMFQKQS